MQDEQHVRDVLGRSNLLPYINKNFNLHLNINTVDGHTPLGKNMHNFLSGAIEKNKGKLPELLQKHKAMLSQDKNFHLNLEDFLTCVWGEFTFGPDMHAELYTKMRGYVLKTSRHVFYNNQMAYIPLLGWLSTKYYRSQIEDDIRQINEHLRACILRCVEVRNSFDKPATKEEENIVKHYDCMIGEYYSQMVDTYGEHTAMNYTIGNAYLSFLVYDFVYGILLDISLRAGTEPQVNFMDTLLNDPKLEENYIYESVKNMFMFPLRFRTIRESYQGPTGLYLQKGDRCILNLKKAKQYFSFGPRSCVGFRMFPNLMHEYLNLFKNSDVITQPQQIQRGSDVNIPMITSTHQLQIVHRTYFKSVIPSYQKVTDKGIFISYDVVDLYRRPRLARALALKIFNIFTNEKLEAIIAPEARGLPLAGMLMQLLTGDEPLVFIRKPNKLPGKTYSSGEYKTAYSTDILEISDESQYESNDLRKIKGKRVMLIDDGVATFGTNRACIDLIERCGAKVARIITINNYHYVNKIDEFRKYESITSNFFDF